MSGPTVVGNLAIVLPPSSVFLDLVLWLIRMIKLLNQFMALHPLAIQFPCEQLHEAEFYLKGRLTFGVQITVSSGNCSCVQGPVSTLVPHPVVTSLPAKVGGGLSGIVKKKVKKPGLPTCTPVAERKI